MMPFTAKSRARRNEIRRNLPDDADSLLSRLQDPGVLASIGLALLFWMGTTAILLVREHVISFRPGQAISWDIVSRVDFVYPDDRLLADKRREAREASPSVYVAQDAAWNDLRDTLQSLPDRAGSPTPDAAIEPVQTMLDGGTVTALRQIQSSPERLQAYVTAVGDFVDALSRHTDTHRGRDLPLILLDEQDRQREIASGRSIRVEPSGVIDPAVTYTPSDPTFRDRAASYASRFIPMSLESKVVEIVVATMQGTHRYDPVATAEEKNRAAERVATSAGEMPYKANMILVPRSKGTLDFQDWRLLKAENSQYLAELGTAARWRSKAGLAGAAFLLTSLLAAYLWCFQPRAIRNHARGAAIVVLLLSMLAVAQTAAIGSARLYLFGVAPVLLAAMVLTIPYDRRFGLGVSVLLSVLVTLGLGTGVGFLLVLLAGVFAACLLLGDVRNRSKIIEVGGAASVAMIFATAAVGLIALEPVRIIAANCLYVGAAGLSVGFIVAGILPFIEQAFGITTSVRLLETADVSHPLMRRLALEAPGTYSHSMQVATLAEAAAEAIGANSLLCRVASYYHDIGKINKADYFVENQVGGVNRHINLSPSVSLLIIIGHVKDGVEMAKAYDLPGAIIPIIQQHHGTTLVEFFYREAVTRAGKQADPTEVSPEQYRYPGPKPRSTEVALVMIADVVESATRAMPEPNAARMESLVHELITRRLLDGQFDECEITMRELALAEKAIVRTILSIYHGRIAYPSTSDLQQPKNPAAMKSA